jgi:hypothetical protein
MESDQLRIAARLEKRSKISALLRLAVTHTNYSSMTLGITEAP